ncbi:MAG: hypothetical protein AW07_00575 [Candidatus Accumulibacter sp. SK-11]|nr:MAG: hypothetical protein AW07_00575 [Candidatus Accumulibacter sp. SK-11]
MTPPWEKPASTIRPSGMPREFSRASRASICRADSRTCSPSSRPGAKSGETMSYQARITKPPLIVTGRMGACGKTKRKAGS